MKPAADESVRTGVTWLPGGDPLGPMDSRVSWFAALLLVLHVTLAWLVRTPGFTTINDHSVYVFLARSLLGGGYNEIWRFDAPWHSQYPPLFPAFFATLIAVVGERIDVLHAAVIAWSAMGLGVVFAVVRRLWGPSLALAVLATCAVNPYLLERAGELMAEPMFITLIAIALWAFSQRELTTRFIVIGCACAIASALTRSAGLPVVIAAGMFLLIQRRWKATAGFVLAAAATVGVWMVWTVVAPDKLIGRSYMADAVYAGPRATAAPTLAVALIRRVIDHVPRWLARGIPWNLPLPGIRGSSLDNAAWLVLVIAGSAAGLVSFWRRWRAAMLVLLMYGAMLAVWPWVEGRFLEPILPLLLTLLMVGLVAIGSRVGGRRGGLATLVAVTALIVGTASGLTGRMVAQYASCDRQSPGQSAGCFEKEERNFFATAEFVKRTTPDSAIVLVAKDAPFAMLSQRKVMIAPAAVAQGTARFFDYLDANHVQRIVLTHISFIDDKLSERLLEVCRRLKIETTIPPFSSVYTWVTAAAAAPDTTAPACRELARYRREKAPLP